MSDSPTITFDELWKFLEDEFPKKDGPGWIQRDIDRRVISDFLTAAEVECTEKLLREAAEAAKKGT